MTKDEITARGCESCNYVDRVDGGMECLAQEERDYFGVADDEDCPCYIPFE